MRKDEAIERTFKGVAKNFREVFADLVPGGWGNGGGWGPRRKGRVVSWGHGAGWVQERARGEGSGGQVVRLRGPGAAWVGEWGRVGAEEKGEGR